MKVCVFLSEDYKQREYLDVEDSLSDSQIIEIVNGMYDVWYYCDFLTKDQEDSMTNND